MPPTWTVAQIGARENYAAARAFAPLGRLNRLYTDIWCRVGAGLLRRGPALLRTLAGRVHSAVPSGRVISFGTGAILGEIQARIRPARTPAGLYDEYLRVGRWFDGRVTAHLARRPPPAGPSAFFAYNTGCLESVRLLRARGVVTVVDQIDPARVEYDIVRAEAAKWPGWADAPPAIPDAYFDRLAAEWEAADAVVVNSAWSADALVTQGVPRKKVHVVPLAYDPPGRAESASDLSNADSVRSPSRLGGGPLVVLWLGNVILRKGIQYLVEAARRLAGQPIRFVVVGPIGISQSAISAAPPNMEFLGRTTRDRTAAAYGAADLFVLPTLSDGFAITQLEAMAHGLPVIATPNCGAVVEHGKDGLVVPAGDAVALAAAIAELADDADRRCEMGRNAVVKSRTFSLAAFADRLDAVAGLSADHRNNL
jgi:glycosyltransferase involved in cell wall biosynthesis